MTTATITPVLVPSARSVRLSIAVDAAGVGETMSVTRRVGTAVPAAVMGATGLAAGSKVITDPEAPLNRAATWIVTFSGGLVVESDPLTVTAALASISDPVLGATAECAVVDRDSLTRTQRAEVLMVEQDPEPWVVWDVPVGKSMPVTMLTLTPAAESALDRMLATGDPILLRCVCGNHTDRWIQPVDDETSVTRLVKRPSDTSRLWDLGLCVVYSTNPRLDEAARGNTLGDLYNAVTPKTLGAIADRWPTLGAIAEDDL